MTALTNNTALTLKFRLETALHKSRHELCMNEVKYLLVEKGIFEETKRVRTMEEACEEDIRERMARRFNLVLWKYYEYGEKLYYHEQKARWNNHEQMAAAFLYDYFKSEPNAVHHLEDVTPSAIKSLNAIDKSILLEERPLQNTRVRATPGRSDSRADDLWRPLSENPEISPECDNEEVDLLSLQELIRGKWSDEPSSPKRLRVTSPALSDPDTVTSQIRDADQPPREFLATEAFWEEYIRNDEARSLEPADPSRKHKSCD